jgi:hypothetical protein
VRAREILVARCSRQILQSCTCGYLGRRPGTLFEAHGTDGPKVLALARRKKSDDWAEQDPESAISSVATPQARPAASVSLLVKGRLVAPAAIDAAHKRLERAGSQHRRVSNVTCALEKITEQRNNGARRGASEPSSSNPSGRACGARATPEAPRMETLGAPPNAPTTRANTPRRDWSFLPSWALGPKVEASVEVWHSTESVKLAKSAA